MEKLPDIADGLTREQGIPLNHGEGLHHRSGGDTVFGSEDLADEGPGVLEQQVNRGRAAVCGHGEDGPGTAAILDRGFELVVDSGK